MRLQYFRGNVFVANLPPQFSEEQLAEVFDPFGMVLSASIARDPETGHRLRHGFVDIATERAANLAIEALNGTEIGGYKLAVRVSERPGGAKKAAVGAKRPPPRRMPLRVASAPAEPDDPAMPRPRKQPTFQVERRSLPRRF